MVNNSCKEAPCCCSVFHYKPNTEEPFYIDWKPQLKQHNGFSLTVTPITELTIKNLVTAAVPVTTEIDIIAADGTNKSVVANDGFSKTLIEVGNAPLGNRYRIDIVQYARDCNHGTRPIKMTHCVIIEIVDC